VYYSTDDVPADRIRAAELQHVFDQYRFDKIAIADSEQLENERFRYKWTCEAGCSALKFRDKTRRLGYLLWDITKGHDASGGH
jgi:hypothetical protein